MLLASNTLKRRLRGIALKLMQYGMCIEYREGASNGNANGLNRQAWVITAEDKRKVPDSEMSRRKKLGNRIERQ